MKPLVRSLVLNSGWILVARILEGLIQLGLVALILAKTTKEVYAAAILILSIQATVDLARGGVQKATIKYLAEHRARDQFDSASAVLSVSVAIQGIVGFLGLLVACSVAPFAATVFALPPALGPDAVWATVLTGAAVFAVFALSPWQNSLAAMERYDLVSITRIFGRLVRAVSVVLLLFSSLTSPLIALVASYGLGSLFEVLSSALFQKSIDRRLRFAFGCISWQNAKLLVRFASLDFFQVVSGFLYGQGALFLAAHLVSLDAAASLGIIWNISAFTGLVTTQVTQMLVPVVSRLEAEGQADTIRRIVVRGTALTVIAGGVVITGLVPWVRSFLRLWLGGGFEGIAIPAILVIWADYLVTTLTCIHNPLGGVGRVGFDGVSGVLCTTAGLASAVGLVEYGNMGLLGIAIGLLLARVLRFVVIVLYGASVFHIPFRELAWEAILRQLALGAGVCALGLWAGWSATSWPQLVALGGLSAGLFLLATGLTWGHDERTRFAGEVSRVFRGRP